MKRHLDDLTKSDHNIITAADDNKDGMNKHIRLDHSTTATTTSTPSSVPTTQIKHRAMDPLSGKELPGSTRYLINGILDSMPEFHSFETMIPIITSYLINKEYLLFQSIQPEDGKNGSTTLIAYCPVTNTYRPLIHNPLKFNHPNHWSSERDLDTVVTTNGLFIQRVGTSSRQSSLLIWNLHNNTTQVVPTNYIQHAFMSTAMFHDNKYYIMDGLTGNQVPIEDNMKDGGLSIYDLTSSMWSTYPHDPLNSPQLNCRFEYITKSNMLPNTISTHHSIMTSGRLWIRITPTNNQPTAMQCYNFNTGRHSLLSYPPRSPQHPVSQLLLWPKPPQLNQPPIVNFPFSRLTARQSLHIRATSSQYHITDHIDEYILLCYIGHPFYHKDDPFQLYHPITQHTLVFDSLSLPIQTIRPFSSFKIMKHYNQETGVDESWLILFAGMVRSHVWLGWRARIGWHVVTVNGVGGGSKLIPFIGDWQKFEAPPHLFPCENEPGHFRLIGVIH
jgi:hypothetical protein